MFVCVTEGVEKMVKERKMVEILIRNVCFQKHTKVAQCKNCRGKTGEIPLDFYLLSKFGTRKGEESPLKNCNSSPFSDPVKDNVFMPA